MEYIECIMAKTTIHQPCLVWILFGSYRIELGHDKTFVTQAISLNITWIRCYAKTVLSVKSHRGNWYYRFATIFIMLYCFRVRRLKTKREFRAGWSASDSKEVTYASRLSSRSLAPANRFCAFTSAFSARFFTPCYTCEARRQEIMTISYFTVLSLAFLVPHSRARCKRKSLGTGLRYGVKISIIS